MGKLTEGFTGGFCGSVGNTVGYRWRGKWCLRMRPAHYRDAKSESQLAQRERFRQVLAFASRAKEALRKGLNYVSRESGMTECNRFMRLNNKRFTLQEGALNIDYEALRFSEGPVAPVAFESCEMIDETTLRLGFEKNPLRRVASGDDEVYVLLYLPAQERFVLSRPVRRRERQIDIALEERWVGAEMQLWAFVRDYAGRASETIYIGNGEPMAAEDEELLDMEAGAEGSEYSKKSDYSDYSEYSDYSDYSDYPAEPEEPE